MNGQRFDNQGRHKLRPTSDYLLNAVFLDGIWDAVGKEILCVGVLEKGHSKIQHRDEKNDTILAAEKYEMIINS